MATPWFRRIQKTGQLTVFNKAKTWAVPVNAAIKTFNGLSFGVELVAAKTETDAHIVLILADGPAQFKKDGTTLSTSSKFKYDELHGQTSTLADEKPRAIFFAAIFLPGKIKNATATQKEMVVVHEFIHACGLNDQAADHELEGIMVAQVKQVEGGIIEYLGIEGAKSMPPVRVGPKTMCKMKMLWAGGGGCKD